MFKLYKKKTQKILFYKNNNNTINYFVLFLVTIFVNICIHFNYNAQHWTQFRQNIDPVIFVTGLIHSGRPSYVYRRI